MKERTQPHEQQEVSHQRNRTDDSLSLGALDQGNLNAGATMRSTVQSSANTKGVIIERKGQKMETHEVLVTDADRTKLETQMELWGGGEAGRTWESIKRLHEKLDHARVMPASKIPEDTVTMNSIVLIRDVDTGEEHVVTLVYPSCANIGERKTSVMSAKGTALLGQRIGDEVAYPIGEAIRHVRIVDVVYQPETAGHAYL